MKKLIITFFLCSGLIFLVMLSPKKTYAACNWSYSASSVTAATCGIDAASSEYYDYSSAADDATNGYEVIIPNAVTVTVNAGTNASTLTKLGVGKFTVTGTGTLAVSANFIQVLVGSKCYVYDGDADGYSATPTTCSTTGGAGYVRKNKLTGTTADCGDGTNLAYPGSTTARSTTFTNTLTGLSYDWNCNGTETKTYATATYACLANCTTSGYPSSNNLASGFSGSVPACGASGTYYTVTNGAACLAANNTNCAGAYTTSTVTQTCL